MIPDFLEMFYSSYKDNLSLRFEGQPNLESFLKELESAFKWTNSNMLLKPIESNDGSAILMFREKNATEAYFGYTAIYNYKHHSNLWSNILEVSKKMNIKHLKGPIHGTTFFPYRFISKSDGSPFFKGEYFSNEKEHHFMVAQAPKKTLTYSSGYRTDYNNVMNISKPYYIKFKNRGLKIKHWRSIDKPLFDELYGIIEKIFHSNWGYNRISQEDFFKLFSPKSNMSPKMLLHTVHMNQNLIGFCSYTENDENTLICKTIGILPEYQRMGIANAVVYKMHADAIDSKYNKMIYGLVMDDNRVKNMPTPDVTRFRSYASYEFDL